MKLGIMNLILAGGVLLGGSAATGIAVLLA